MLSTLIKKFYAKFFDAVSITFAFVEKIWFGYMKFILILAIIIQTQCFTVVGHQFIKANTKDLPEKEVTCLPNFIYIKFAKSKSFAEQYSSFYYTDIFVGAMGSFYLLAQNYPVITTKILIPSWVYGTLALIYTEFFVGMENTFYSSRNHRVSELDFRDWAGEFKQNCKNNENYFYFSIVNSHYHSLGHFKFNKNENQNFQSEKESAKNIFKEKILTSIKTEENFSQEMGIQNFLDNEFSSVKKEFCSPHNQDTSYCLYSYYFEGGVFEFQKNLIRIKYAQNFK